MLPSRPSSTNPYAPGRATNAALGAHLVNNQEVDQVNDQGVEQSHSVPAQYQQNLHGELAPRRNVNRDRLNLIAHRLGSGVRVALELITPQQAHPENAAGPSHTAQSAKAPHASHVNVPHAPHVDVNTLRRYFDQRGIRNTPNLRNSTVQNRLDSANLRIETLIAAMEIAHTPDHPTLTALRANENERLMIIVSLSKCMLWREGFDPQVRNIALNAHNNPDNLVSGIIQRLRNAR